ncbi:MAG: histidine phosphatase family protein [Anaerolineaceae bacterium]
MNNDAMEKMNIFASDPKDGTRVILVRHGRTSANKDAKIGSVKDYPLDEVGNDQAQRVAKRLKDFNISAIYSSPILRTKQTAQAIADRIGLNIAFRKELQEFIFGSIADHTMEEIKKEDEETYNELIAWMSMGQEQTMARPVIPDAETMQEFEARIRKFTKEMLDNHEGQTICAVTHMGWIKGFMAIYFGGGVGQRMNFNALNTSITVIDFYKQVPVLSGFNDISHLDISLPYGRVNLL